MELLLIALAVIGLMVILPISIMFNAFVLHKMWAWFMVPLGVMPIGLAHAWGISILIAMFTHSRLRGKDKEEKIAEATGILLGPAFALLFGWIAHSLM